MQELSWIDHLPGKTLDRGIALLNRLLWNISSGQASDGKWLVQAGHCVIFKSDSKDAKDAFLFGMSLSYAVMNQELLQQHREHMLREAGFDPADPPADL